MSWFELNVCMKSSTTPDKVKFLWSFKIYFSTFLGGVTTYYDKLNGEPNVT